MIAGSENNQLSDQKLGEEMGSTLYIPDILANGGGVTSAMVDVRAGDGFTRVETDVMIHGNFENTLKLLKYAAEMGLSTNSAAIQLAEQTLNAAVSEKAAAS